MNVTHASETEEHKHIEMNVKHASETEQRTYFEKWHKLTLRAHEATGTHSATFNVGGSVICIMCAGETLVPHLFPAIEHLRIESEEPADMTFYLWDEETTGIEMLPPPCSRDRFTDRGDIWGYCSKRYKLAFHWGEFSVNLFDVEKGIGIYCVKSATQMPYWVHASPLRTLFHWAMERSGRQLLHAAAVGTDDGAILITGKGGIGKSTTALSCLAAGMNYLADDYVIVGLKPEPMVYNLYSTAKLNHDQVENLPQLAPHVRDPALWNDEKAVLFLQKEFDEQIVLSAPIVAVVTPRIVGGTQSCFSSVSKQRLVRAASFTTLSHLPNADGHTHEFICQVIEQLPSLELKLGDDLKQLPRTIAEFLKNPAPVINEFQIAEAPDALSDPPLITVIIPVYNGAKFLSGAIDSVLSQNYPAIEIIVVNDGSTDNTREVAMGLGVDIRYFEQGNLGPAAARNRGIKDAAGNYIAFLDVDDLWPESNLQRLLDELRGDPDLEFVHGHSQLMTINPESQSFEYIGNPGESFPHSIPGTMFRRSVFERVGLFDASLIFGEDTDWFHRANEMGIGNRRLNEVTLFVRRHGQNMTHGKSIVELNTLRVFKKALDRKRRQA